MAVEYRTHAALDETNNHGIARWRVADAAALAAIVATAAEVDRVAHQLDDNTFWAVVSASPTVWTQLGAGAGCELSDATPTSVGTAAAGVSVDASRADHAHGADPQTATNTAAIGANTSAIAGKASAADLTALSGTVVANTAAIGTNTSAISANTSAIAGKAATATQVIAGAGLTGGGTLAADRTLNVVAGDASIVVAADSVTVGVLQSDASHGTRGGGTLHAAAVDGGASGFMTGAQATKLAAIAALAAALGTATPLVSAGAGSVGVSVAGAHEDHVHPWDWEDGEIFILRPCMPSAPNLRFQGIGVGFTQGAATGGYGAPVVDGGGALSMRPRAMVQTAASAAAGNYVMSTWTFLHTLTGFRFVYDFGLSSTSGATTRWMGGLLNTTTALGNVSMDSLLSGVWVGTLDASANTHLFCNDASGTATGIDLGANFPARTANVMYRLTLTCPPGGASIDYRVERLGSGSATPVTGTLATDLPGASTALGFHHFINTNTGTAAQLLSLLRMTARSRPV
jgi:hypothetical protein